MAFRYRPVLNRPFERITAVRTHVLCAGRTDSGVHAVGRWQISARTQRFRRTHASSPAESPSGKILLLWKREKFIRSFTPRIPPFAKRYRYLIFDGVICPPFLRPLMHRTYERLDADAMNEACVRSRGTHDFRCFETHYPNKMTSVRTVMECTVSRTPLWTPWSQDHRWHDSTGHPLDQRSEDQVNRPLIVLDIMADGFLYNMVRAIAGNSDSNWPRSPSGR